MGRFGTGWIIAGAFVAFVGGCSDRAAPPLSGRTVASTCLGIDLPVETAVSLFGVYEGAPGDGEKRRRPGERQPERVRVETGGHGPEVLILSAYEPVIWDVSAVAKNDLRGVVAYGYHVGQVVGAPSGLPVRIVAYSDESEDQGGGTDRHDACGATASVFEGGPELEKLADQVEAGIGLPIGAFAGTYAASRLSLADPPPPRPAEIAFDGKDIYPGREISAALVERGDIRLATAADIAAWNAKATARLKSARLAPYVDEDLRLGGSYVALRPFTVPDGMTGANSRNFIIPAGMAMPRDKGSHNIYYRLDNGLCIGVSPSCVREERRDQPVRGRWRQNPWARDGG
ncbi:hypothetical protein [Sphingopyxis fribergensis]